jgi:hypothetical protein
VSPELVLIILVIRKRPATKRIRHLESVQKTTGSDMIWEILGFECGAIAASTETCSGTAPLEQRPHAAPAAKNRLRGEPASGAIVTGQRESASALGEITILLGLVTWLGQSPFNSAQSVRSLFGAVLPPFASLQVRRRPTSRECRSRIHETTSICGVSATASNEALCSKDESQP